LAFGGDDLENRAHHHRYHRRALASRPWCARDGTPGWIYWRKRKASPGTRAAAFLEVQSLLEPGRNHVIEAQSEHEEKKSDAAGPPSSEQQAASDEQSTTSGAAGGGLG